MKAKSKLVFAIAAACLLLALGWLLMGAAVWADLAPEERRIVLEIVPQRLPLVVMLGLGGFALFSAIIVALYRTYVATPLRLVEEARLMMTVNRERRLPATGVAEVAALAGSLNELADQRDALLEDVTAKIEAAKASVEQERNRLAALLSELTQGIIVCNLDGRVLLYNNRARLQFQSSVADAQTGVRAGSMIGLGRSIFALLERNLIAHALDNLQYLVDKKSAHAVASFVTATAAGQLLRVQMSPVLGTAGPAGHEGGVPAEPVEPTLGGYVLIIDNITDAFESGLRRDDALRSLTEGSRAALENLRVSVEMLRRHPDMIATERDDFIASIDKEVGKLGQHVQRSIADQKDAVKARWPLEEMLGADFVAAVRRHVEARVAVSTAAETVDETVWLMVDSFSLLLAVTFLASRLHEQFGIVELRLRLAREGRWAHLDLVWSGPDLGAGTVHEWEKHALSFGGQSSLLTVREVAERHGSELGYQADQQGRQCWFRIPIPVATERNTEAVLAQAHSTLQGYDFELFRQHSLDHRLDDRLLTEVSYTVFDTETTGLEPSAGDEIIQIGATRIVNGRLLRGECFDQLLDPQRSLKPESIAIHGITPDMVRGQPTIDAVLPAFFDFCAETVLVGHNAAFDMRFLQIKEAALGIRFEHPLLDTLLLSPVIHPNQESHRLEAIAERLGVVISGRHNALGDAVVTGEVFLKMIPLLAERGIRTLREAREASEKSYYARVKY